MQAIDSIVTSEMKQQFEEDGYFVPEDQEELLRLANLSYLYKKNISKTKCSKLTRSVC